MKYWKGAHIKYSNSPEVHGTVRAQAGQVKRQINGQTNTSIIQYPQRHSWEYGDKNRSNVLSKQIGRMTASTGAQFDLWVGVLIPEIFWRPQFDPWPVKSIKSTQQRWKMMLDIPKPVWSDSQMAKQDKRMAWQTPDPWVTLLPGLILRLIVPGLTEKHGK